MNKGDFILVACLGVVLLAYLQPLLACGLIILFFLVCRNLVILVFLGLVFIRCFCFYANFEATLDYELNKLYYVEAHICAEPDVRLDKINYILCLNKLVEVENNEVLSVPKSNRVLLKYSLYPKFEYGDTVSIKGLFELPFETEEFSYKNYLKIYGVSLVLNKNGNLNLISQNSTIFGLLYTFKNYLLLAIEKLFNEPYASLVNGLLLGSRKGFSEEVTNYLSVTGLTHIVAVSGYNISLVILFIDKLFIFVPRNIRFYLICFFLAIFAVITGLSASVLRATIMGVIAIAVIQYGYSANFNRAILLAACAMTVWNPFVLLYDLGFQLSFFSTFGVVLLSKKLTANFLPEFLGIRESFILTISSQIATLPTIVYYFGVLSLVSPLANVLVAPFLPVFMLFGFLSLLFSWILPLKIIFILIVETLGYFFFLILKFLAGVPYASLTFQPKNLILLFLSLILIFILGRRKF
jgi:competence protein ComEC